MMTMALGSDRCVNNNTMDLTYEQLSEKTLADLTRTQANDFVRAIALQAKFSGDPNADHIAIRNFPIHYPRSLNVSLFQKAAVAPATTLDSTWAAPLSPLRPLADAFVALLRPRTLADPRSRRCVDYRTSTARRSPPSLQCHLIMNSAAWLNRLCRCSLPLIDLRYRSCNPTCQRGRHLWMLPEGAVFEDRPASLTLVAQERNCVTRHWPAGVFERRFRPLQSESQNVAGHRKTRKSELLDRNILWVDAVACRTHGGSCSPL